MGGAGADAGEGRACERGAVAGVRGGAVGVAKGRRRIMRRGRKKMKRKKEKNSLTSSRFFSVCNTIV